MRKLMFMTLALLVAISCGNNQANKSTGRSDTDSTAVHESVFDASVLPEEPIFDIVTTMGTISVKLYAKTPRHRDNFIKLANERFYQGILFHRVINGFMIQAGDPYTRDTTKTVDLWGQGGPGYTVPAEFVNEYYHKKGALCAARMGDIANPSKASSGSQFYLVQDEMACLHLDGQYTVFGETVQGLEVIDRIACVQTDSYDRPVNPVMIMQVVPNKALMEKEWKEKLAADTLK